MDSKVKFFAIVAAVSVVLFAFALVWYTNKPSTPGNGRPADVQEAMEEDADILCREYTSASFCFQIT